MIPAWFFDGWNAPGYLDFDVHMLLFASCNPVLSAPHEVMFAALECLSTFDLLEPPTISCAQSLPLDNFIDLCAPFI